MKKEISNLTIKYNDTIKIAVKKLNLSGKKFLAVVDNKNKYMGSLTDSDIRRNILNNLGTNTIISKIFNRKSRYVFAKNFSEKNRNFFLISICLLMQYLY